MESDARIALDDGKLALCFAAIADGRTDALSHLYDLTAPTVWGVVRHLLGDGPESETALAHVYGKLKRIGEAGLPAGVAPGALIVETARHSALDLKLKKQGALDPILEALEMVPANLSPVGAPEGQPWSIVSVLETLHPDQAEAIRAAWICGEGFGDLAADIGADDDELWGALLDGLAALRADAQP